MRRAAHRIAKIMSCQYLRVFHGFSPPARAGYFVLKRHCHDLIVSSRGRDFQLNSVKLTKSLPRSAVMPLLSIESRDETFGSSSKRLTIRDNLSGEASTSRLILVDGKALVYRAYYKISAKIFHGSLKKMSREDAAENSSWDSTMTTIVALTEVLNLLDLQPSHVAVVFDFQGATFRHHLFPEYKGHRPQTPDTVNQAVRDTKHALVAMGLKVIEVPGLEADDVIGTLALQAVGAGMKVRVASPDKDFFQILSPPIRLLRFRPKGSGFLSFGVEEFNQKYPNLEVSQFVDMQALVGDPVDNIPGVRGIGDVTARKLIHQFGTLEALLERRAEVFQDRARASLLLDSGGALLSKQLLLLKLDVPVYAMGCTLESLSCGEPEDAGKGYSRLINAFGAIVGPTTGVELMQRTREYWMKLKLIV